MRWNAPSWATAAAAFVAIALSGCAQSETESDAGTETATAATSKPTRHSSAASHRSMKSCGEGTLANVHASCSFARNVTAAYKQADSDAVNAWSPTTRREYLLVCLPIDNETRVHCTTGDAGITFPFERQGPPASGPPPSESTAPETGEGGGGEDEVGSRSHTGDHQFCEEHECIGDFEGEEGTVVECTDGSYSHAGGISGACSDHGGES
jgi:hypothetical protein